MNDIVQVPMFELEQVHYALDQAVTDPDFDAELLIAAMETLQPYLKATNSDYLHAQEFDDDIPF